MTPDVHVLLLVSEAKELYKTGLVSSHFQHALGGAKISLLEKVIINNINSATKNGVVIDQETLFTAELWRQIHILVDVVCELGGTVNKDDASMVAARRANISISDMPYVVMSAVAENLLTWSLRTNKLELVTKDNPAIPLRW